MAEPVTSKYEIAYWIKVIGMSVIGLMGIIAIIYFSAIGDSFNRSQNISTTLGLFVATVVFLGAKLISSPPQKIVVSAENIAIYGYLNRKQVTINYADINSLSTVRPQSDGVSLMSQINNYQGLAIELNNGKRYRINENDFDNYDDLKSAIYDHMFRNK